MRSNERFEIEEPSSADIAFLEDRLYEFNAGATGIADGRGLGVFLWVPAAGPNNPQLPGPGFYRKLGFEVVSELGDYPRGAVPTAALMRLLHVMLAVAFIAGLLGRAVAFRQARLARNLEVTAALLTLSDWFDRRLVVPGSLLVLLSGMVMTWVGRWPLFTSPG